jgi:membrane protein DedA with SNARE-associated domain
VSLSGRNNVVAAVTMPAFASGIFRVKFPAVVLGAAVAWIGVYVGLPYFLGAEIARRIGSAGPKVVLGAVLVVVAGLVIRAGLPKWRLAQRVKKAG